MAGNRPRTATLKEVALTAGVSRSTASRALDDGRHVSPETLERVRAAARALDYRANHAARSLRRARSMTIGVIFHQLRGIVTLDILDGVGSVSDDSCNTLLVTDARNSPDRYRFLIRSLFERRVDGLLLVNPESAVAQEVALLRAAGIPVIALFSRGRALQDIPLVTASEDRAVEAAISSLANRGHRLVLNVSSPRASQSRRPASLDDSGARHGIAVIHEIVTSEGDVSRVLEKHLQGNHRPTAVVSLHGHLPVTLTCLQQLHLQVPADVSVLTFDNTTLLDQLLPLPIASIYTDTAELGRHAGSALVDWIGGVEPDNVMDFDLPRWVEQPSVGPVPR